MKTLGAIYSDQSRDIVSVLLNDSGEPRMETVPPYERPEGYVDPILLPLIKKEAPVYNQFTEKVEPIIKWFQDRVERDWQILPLTPEEIVIKSRKVWSTSARYLNEFTLLEIGQISLSTDPTIAALRLLMSSWDGEVWSDDLRVVAGLDALESNGIIDSSRRSEILA